MKIFSIAVNMHDHNTYDGTLHYQEERYSKIKHNLNKHNPQDPTLSREFFLKQFIPNYNNRSNNTVFSFSCSNLGKEFVFDLLDSTLGDTGFLSFKPVHLWDHCFADNCYYIDHHQSHAAYAFLSSRFLESDILAIDGRGWHFTCIFVNKYGNITDLSSQLSIGGLWNKISQELGLGYLGAGKLMGLSAYGSFNNTVYTIVTDYLNSPNCVLLEKDKLVLKTISKENIAYTLQHTTMEIIKKTVYPLKTSDNICIAGGVAYNGYVNEEFTKKYKNVHVPPAVGDEGQAIGTYMHADYVLNKNVHIPNTYSGANHVLNIEIFKELPHYQKPMEDINKEIAAAIANGAIVGWYQNCSESGNRALGNRSILADPRNPFIKKIINDTIKFREDYRPFAPSVLEEYYKEYFDTNQPSPYMSRIVPVTSNKIPGVTHADGTARIQTVTKESNCLFYNLINQFYKLTGIPMLLNTSFNCQEPIVETPEQALDTFLRTELDILVINNWVIKK